MEQKLDCLQAMEINQTNKKPQVFRIRSLGKTSQQDEIVNAEVRLKANCLDRRYTAWLDDKYNKWLVLWKCSSHKAQETVKLIADNVLREPEVLYLPEVIWICMWNLGCRMVCSQSSEDCLAD